MIALFIGFGLLVFVIALVYFMYSNSTYDDIGGLCFLALISLALGFMLPTPEEIHSSSLKEFNTCTEFLLYYPDANIISRGAVSMSAVPLECKGQFEAFYEAHTNWDLSYAWEKFKQYKIKQII